MESPDCAFLIKLTEDFFTIIIMSIRVERSIGLYKKKKNDTNRNRKQGCSHSNWFNAYFNVLFFILSLSVPICLPKACNIHTGEVIDLMHNTFMSQAYRGTDVTYSTCYWPLMFTS